MKKVLYIVITLGMVSTFAGAVEWMDLSDKDCDRYGQGTCHLASIYTCGCYGKIKRAEKICRRAGGRLPTMNELKSVALSCGVRPTEFGYNKLSHAFYDCIRKKGFLRETYWSKSRSKIIPQYRAAMAFNSGSIDSDSPTIGKQNIRCVR